VELPCGLLSLASLYEALRATPEEPTLPPGSQPPSWSVHMALRRCGNLNAGAILSPDEQGSTWTLVRPESEITRAEFSTRRAPGSHRKQLRIPAAKAAEILRRLGSSPAVNPGSFTELRTARMRTGFQDGVVATVTASSQGWVQYYDNRYYLNHGLFVATRQLADEVLAAANHTMAGWRCQRSRDRGLLLGAPRRRVPRPGLSSPSAAACPGCSACRPTSG
jgi:hypothetical protein